MRMTARIQGKRDLRTYRMIGGAGWHTPRNQPRSSIPSSAETPAFTPGRSAGYGAVEWMRTEDAAGRAVAGGNPGDACGGAVRLRLGTAQADIPGSWCR